MFRRNKSDWLLCTLMVLAAGSGWSQQAPQSLPNGAFMPAPMQTASATPAGAGLSSTLKQAFDAAWLRQPEALSQQARQEAGAARRSAADSWTAEPASVELATKTDRLNQNLGSREVFVGLTMPLWLPGERARTGAVADAENRVATSRVQAAQLRTAAVVREAYWHWQRARAGHELARERLNSSQQIAADVARRVKAGDLARSDQHQTDGAVASAEVELAEAAGTLAGAVQRLLAQFGLGPVQNDFPMPFFAAVMEAIPEVPTDLTDLDTRHPAVAGYWIGLKWRAGQPNWCNYKRAPILNWHLRRRGSVGNSTRPTSKPSQWASAYPSGRTVATGLGSQQHTPMRLKSRDSFVWSGSACCAK